MQLAAVMLAAAQINSPLFQDLQMAARRVEVGRPTSLAASWSGKPLRIELGSVAMTGCATAGWLYGVSANGRDRCTHLGRLQVTLGGRAFTTPTQAYADLGEIHQAVLRTSTGHATLYLRGAEGAEDYGVTMIFDQRGLVERQVYWPDGSAEITRYVTASE